MLVTIIILSIIIVILLLYLVLSLLNNKKEKEEEYKRGAGELFYSLLKVGYTNRVNFFKDLNEVSDKEDSIVFVGDSLTENYNVYENFKGLNVYNRGIGGDTTEGLLKRMNESIFDLNPSIVVLLIGINDFELIDTNTPLDIKNRIEQIINEVKTKSPSTKIILESLYPVHESQGEGVDLASVNHKKNKNIQEVNNLIKTIDGIYYLDIYPHLLDENNELKMEYSLEGLHINQKGYEIITKLIKEKIKEVKNNV